MVKDIFDKHKVDGMVLLNHQTSMNYIMDYKYKPMRAMLLLGNDFQEEIFKSNIEKQVKYFVGYIQGGNDGKKGYLDIIRENPDTILSNLTPEDLASTKE